MTTMIPVGSTVTRVYFTVMPHGSTIAPIKTTDDWLNARNAAIQHFEAREIVAKDYGQILDERHRPVILERWVLEFPHGGGVDMEIRRDVLTDGMIYARKASMEAANRG
jgi:hypothetical protein